MTEAPTQRYDCCAPPRYYRRRIVQKVPREKKDRRTGSSELQKEMRVGPSMSAGRGRHQTRQCGWSPKGFGREQLLKRQH
jgi:hypothetical protein